MKATLIGTLEPVIASVTSAIVLGTTFHPVELVGYACIIATVFIIILQKKRQHNLFRNAYFSCIIEYI